jgi:hypothetical protein
MAKKKTNLKSKHPATATKKVVKKNHKHISKPSRKVKLPKKAVNTAKPKLVTKPIVLPTPKKSKIEILEADTKIREISEFEMNEIVSRLVHKAKTRKRNRNTIE